MKVAHIIDEKVVVSEVPDNWIKCSVLGEFRPPEEYRNEGEDYQSRTNCTRAYMMPTSEWVHHKEVAKKLKPELDRAIAKLGRELMEKTAGISVDSLIEMLLEIKAENPDARVAVCYDGEVDSPSIIKLEIANHTFSNLYQIY